MNDSINYWQLFLTFITVIISSLITWWLNSYSKRREIKLVNYHKDQIDKTKELYSLLVELNIITNSFYLLNTIPTNFKDFGLRIDTWNKSYIGCILFYRKNRILFPEYLKIQIDNHFDVFKHVRIVILNQKNVIEDELEYVHEYCESYDDEVIHYENIFNTFRSDSEIKKILKTSIELQKDIENYFKKLVE
jgi:hypothetical protein